MNAKSPAGRGFSRCAEEDSNLHPVIPDQALNLVTRVSYTSISRQIVRIVPRADDTDASDDRDVATTVAAAPTCIALLESLRVRPIGAADDAARIDAPVSVGANDVELEALVLEPDARLAVA